LTDLFALLAAGSLTIARDFQLGPDSALSANDELDIKMEKEKYRKRE
jgi:hypothetical protein